MTRSFTPSGGTPAPRLRIPVSVPDVGAAELARVTEAVRSGWISSMGPYVQAFEDGFAGYCDRRHGVATMNGTVALHLVLRALDVGPGDEVIVPALTFVACANAVHYTGARPVLADVDPDSGTLDPASVRSRLTDRTRAILAVHLYGVPCQWSALRAIADETGVALIEDAAEAHGATWEGRRVGSLGVASCFSFYGNKILTTGEGGIVLTDDDALAGRLRFLRDHAMDPVRRYHHEEIGFNYRMTSLQAAVGQAQLERLDAMLARREAVRRRYRDGLGGVAGLRFPEAPAGATSVCWMFCAIVEDAFGVDRDALATGLAARGIDSRPYFVPLHRLPPYAETRSYPVAESLGERGINLPTSSLLADAQVDEVCAAVREVAGA